MKDVLLVVVVVVVVDLQVTDCVPVEDDALAPTVGCVCVCVCVCAASSWQEKGREVGSGEGKTCKLHRFLLRSFGKWH